jgi:hypothetical protein
MDFMWSRSAPRHRISRDRSRFVVEHCGLVFEETAPAGAPAGAAPRLVYPGDDPDGIALEVMAVELEDDALLVIHAMALRDRYREQYQEAKQWRK